ncbi:MAG: HPr family phosphocarrier protein [Planctomycetota bacterium]|nr:HPr family phosphocarrier protein [Planctomycetota bacterium]
MTTAQQEVRVVNKYGLHARPAMQLVQLANSYTSTIEVSDGTLTVDGKSIMSVMRLGAAKGATLKFVADGEDAQEAVAAMAKLVEDGFGEMQGSA